MGIKKVEVVNKDKLILKYPFGVFKSSKKKNIFFLDFCPRLSKEVKSKKKALYTGFHFDSLTLLF